MMSELPSNRPRPASPVSRALADELRAESARKRIGQADVQRAIGRSQGYVSERWNGLASLQLDEFLAWASLVGADPAQLLARARASVSHPQEDYDLAAFKPDAEDGSPGSNTSEGFESA